MHPGDSFTDNQLGAYLGKAAAVVCEPPFDRPDWPVAELTTDRRWEFGIPAPRDAELAWVQHCYAHLRPHGVAVVAVPQRTCVQPSGEHIRAALVGPGCCARHRAASGMGRRPAPTCACGCCGAQRDARTAAPVRVIDLTGLGDWPTCRWSRAPGSSCSGDDPTVVPGGGAA